MLRHPVRHKRLTSTCATSPELLVIRVQDDIVGPLTWDTYAVLLTNHWRMIEYNENSLLSALCRYETTDCSPSVNLSIEPSGLISLMERRMTGVERVESADELLDTMMRLILTKPPIESR